MWPRHSAYVELFGRPATTVIQTIPPLRRSPSDKERATRRSDAALYAIDDDKLIHLSENQNENC